MFFHETNCRLLTQFVKFFTVHGFFLLFGKKKRNLLSLKSRVGWEFLRDGLHNNRCTIVLSFFFILYRCLGFLCGFFNDCRMNGRHLFSIRYTFFLLISFSSWGNSKSRCPNRKYRPVAADRNPVDTRQSLPCLWHSALAALSVAARFSLEDLPNWNHRTIWEITKNVSFFSHFFSRSKLIENFRSRKMQKKLSTDKNYETQWMAHLCFCISLIPPFWYPSRSAGLSLKIKCPRQKCIKSFFSWNYS